MFDIIRLIIETLPPIIILIFWIKIIKLLKIQEIILWIAQKILGNAEVSEAKIP